MWCIRGITQQHTKREEQKSGETSKKMAMEVVYACCIERIVLDQTRTSVKKK